MIVIRDPDNYPIQIISQDYDLHAELHAVCREVVVDGVEKSLEDIRRSNDPATWEEAGISLAKSSLDIPNVKAPSTSPC